ncbi:MAG TPA: hypothetical protein VMS78_03395 [Rhizomicrobium sp.]|nr:hypothetical protein [Rhizomicrobium sp.]
MWGLRGAKPGSPKKPVAGAIALVAALALSGCSSVDDMVFGGTSDAGSGVPQDTGIPPDTSQNPDTSGVPQPAPAPVQTASTAGTLPPVDNSSVPSAPSSYPDSGSYPSSSGNLPGTLPPVADYGATPAPVEQAAATPANGVSITPVTVEPGTDTGTPVSQTVQQLRSQLEGLEQRLSSGAQRLTDIRTANVSSATTYQTSKAQIMTRLQLGTTRGNPELVAQWNTAQTALDQLSANINTLNAVGTDVTTDSSSAHFVLDQIVATFNVSGAVDEDHRQLAVLEDETNQTIILIDRLLKSVADDIQRQTAYVANERANLTTLANGIKNGELYSADMMPMMGAARPMSAGNFNAGGGAIAVVRNGNGNFQQSLYSSLNQTLASQPNANFEIVAVSPTRGTSNAVQIAQTTTKRRAQEVLRAMTDMGVPASRMEVSASTDPGLASGEVRVYQR